MATAQITSERIDDIPLFIQWLLNMHIDKIIDAVVKPPHGNRQGLSYGQLTVVFMVKVIGHPDFLVVGDCKLASLANAPWSCRVTKWHAASNTGWPNGYSGRNRPSPC